MEQVKGVFWPDGNAGQGLSVGAIGRERLEWQILIGASAIGIGITSGSGLTRSKLILLGISRRDKRLHGSVYALIMLVWGGIVAWNVAESGRWSSQQPRSGCIIGAVGSINLAAIPALMLTIMLIATGRSGRAAFRRMLMVLPVLRDTYAENLQAAEARGEAKGREIGVEEGEERGVARAKEWYERKRRAEERGERFDEPAPWEE